MFIFPPALLCDLCFWKKFPPSIIKDSSHLHREKVTQTENNTDGDAEENRTRQKRERNVESEMQAGRQTHETA